MAVSDHSFTFKPDAEDSLQHLGAFQREVSDDPNLLILVFANVSAAVMEPVLPWFEALWPRSTVLGLYCGLVIDQGQAAAGSVLVKCIRFERTELRLNFLPWQKDLTELGQRLYEPVIRQGTRAALTFFSNPGTHYSDLFSWINSTRPDVVVAGGRMNSETEGWLYADGRILDNHVAVVTLNNPQLEVQALSFSEWHLIGRTWTVTKAIGNTLYELDHRPAQELYAHYLNDNQPLSEADIRNFPLMRVSGEAHTLSVPVYNTDYGGFNVSTPLFDGDHVRFAYSHPSMTFEQVCSGAQKLGVKRPELILAFNCFSRAGFDSDEPDLELRPLQSIAPVSGAYCFGEFFHENGRTLGQEHSLTVLAIAEDKAAAQPLPEYSSHSLAPLFRLIQESVKDLDQVNRDLEEEISRKTRELFRKYETDNVTGLANRVALLQCLTDADPWPVVQLCSLKVNNLRQINNLYGYAVGDQLLRNLSTAIQTDITELLPTTALVFRGSPNEFLIVAPDACSHQSFFKGMGRLTERLQNQSDLFSDRLVQNVLPILLTAGTAHRNELPPGMSHSAEDLLIKASEARRHAHKHQLPIARAVDLPGNEQVKRNGLIWLSRIRTALANEDVLPYIQPLFDRNGNIHHVEALMRIRHDGQIYTPMAFLDLVKPTQLYPRLSMLMIDETCRQLKNHDVGFTLNFTARDLGNEALIERLKYWLKNGIGPDRLTLEIIESDGLRDFDRFAFTLMELRRLGCKLAIDDFGSAYSNLERVLRLKPDWIKLDGSLIRHLNDSEVNRILVKRVVQLCQDLKIRTVAEHVHNKAIFKALKSMGVDYFQGFYLAEPMPVAEFNASSLKRKEIFG